VNDEDCTCDDSSGYAPNTPTYPIDLHDFAGIILGGLGAAVVNAGTCLSLLANEFYASGRYRRQRKYAEIARREAGYVIEQIVEGGS
jgi:hypothetical protein